MTEVEIKQSLAELCQIIKTAIAVLSDLNRSQVALAETVFQKHPEVKALYGEKWDAAMSPDGQSLGPDLSGILLKIDELIQKMKA
jgi:hypothetical protein